MKRPPYTYRLLIILLILTVIPIGATHIGSMYMGPKNGILFSLTYLIEDILPSIPLLPKPGATITPSQPDNFL